MAIARTEPGLPPNLEELINSLEDEGVDPAEVAQRLRDILDAVGVSGGRLDVPLRRRLAQVVERLDPTIDR